MKKLLWLLAFGLMGVFGAVAQEQTVNMAPTISDLPAPVVGNADTTPARDGGGSYTVQSGDTLSAIAQRHYGKASRWQEIFEANRDQIDDPDLIRPGQVLRLPD